MSRFSLNSAPLVGLLTVTRHPIGDERGSLERLFCSRELAAAGWHKPVAQINLTRSRGRGTVRGMHYQRPPHTEMKLVTCLRGEVHDVVVDLRQGSPTFLHCHEVHLSATDPTALLIPEGFAHGFQSLTDDVELLYCHSEAHVAEAEGGLSPTDPRLAITWPLPIAMLSPRDASHPQLTPAFVGLVP